MTVHQWGPSRTRVEPTANGIPGLRLAIILPMVWSVRNVVHSQLLDRLHERGIDVILFLFQLPGQAEVDRLTAPPHMTSVDKLIRVEGNSIFGRAFIESLLRVSFYRRNRNRSHPIYAHWFSRNQKPAAVWRQAFINGLARLCSHWPLFPILRVLPERFYLAGHDVSPVVNQLCLHRPDMILSTVSVSPLEYPYFIAARRLHIPIVSAVLSFDHITSRGILPRADHYCVWSTSMKQQLLRFYPDICEEEVFVTGTTQFDFHRLSEFSIPRENLLASVGLDQSARYILYSGSHEILAPEEPQLVLQLIRRLRSSTSLEHHWVVVRLHPLDSQARWQERLRDVARVVCVPAWETTPDATGWTWSSKKDQARLVSLISHADACVNIASTMTLDAAILNRPVIGLQLRGRDDACQGILYEEYQAEHFRPLLDSGGVSVAMSWDECIFLLEEAIRNPDHHMENRHRMVSQECGEIDGRAAERIADAIGGLLEGRREIHSSDN